jgi:hypothetical protein
MTITIDQVGRARSAEEANGSFAVDLTGTLNVFKDVPAVAGTSKIKLTQPMATPGHEQQHLDGYPTEVLLPKSAEWDFQVNLQTIDTKAAASVQAAQGALGLLLKVFMGGETLGTGTTVTTGATATVVPLTSAAGIAVGTALGFNTGAGGALEIREVKSKSGNTVTLKLALTGAPADGASVLSGATYSMGGTDGSQTTSLQTIVEGLSTAHRWLLAGGQLKSLALALGVGTQPRATFGVSYADFLLANGSNTAANLTSGALGAASYSNTTPLVQQASELRAQTVGTSTLSGTLLHAPTIEFKPNIKYSPHKTPAGRNTIKQWIRDHAPPVLEGAFVVPHEDATWFDARDAATPKMLAYQIGSSFTKGGILIVAPNVQITDVQTEGVGGIHSQRVSWRARLDTDTTEGSPSDLGRSAFRIHLI